MELSLVLAYMGLLYCGAMIAPGIGLSGHLLVQIPSGLLDWAHAPGYGLLAWLLSRGLQRREWPFSYALAVGAAAAFVFGLWTEVFQASVPGRNPSSDDLMRDAIGIGLAAVGMVFSLVWPNRVYPGRRLHTSVSLCHIIRQGDTRP